MNNFLANLYADLGHEKLLQLHGELLATHTRLAETCAMISMAIHNLF